MFKELRKYLMESEEVVEPDTGSEDLTEEENEDEESEEKELEETIKSLFEDEESEEEGEEVSEDDESDDEEEKELEETIKSLFEDEESEEEGEEVSEEDESDDEEALEEFFNMLEEMEEDEEELEEDEVVEIGADEAEAMLTDEDEMDDEEDLEEAIREAEEAMDAEEDAEVEKEINEALSLLESVSLSELAIMTKNYSEYKEVYNAAFKKGIAKVKAAGYKPGSMKEYVGQVSSSALKSYFLINAQDLGRLNQAKIDGFEIAFGHTRDDRRKTEFFKDGEVNFAVAFVRKENGKVILKHVPFRRFLNWNGTKVK